MLERLNNIKCSLFGYLAKLISSDHPDRVIAVIALFAAGIFGAGVIWSLKSWNNVALSILVPALGALSILGPDRDKKEK